MTAAARARRLCDHARLHRRDASLAVIAYRPALWSSLPRYRGTAPHGVAPRTLSPSRIARFYSHERERFLRFASVTRDAREEEGVPKPQLAGLP